MPVSDTAEVEHGSEEEEDDCSLKTLDWLITYRLPEYFALPEDLTDHGAALNGHSVCSNPILSEKVSYCEKHDPMQQRASDILTEKRFAPKCSLLCWVYRMLATSSERRLSLNDIYRRFVILNPDWERLSPDWKSLVGQALLSSKCFIYKHSLWSINPEFALKHERAALAQGTSHCCPPSASSACERSLDEVLRVFRQHDSREQNYEL